MVFKRKLQLRWKRISMKGLLLKISVKRTKWILLNQCGIIQIKKQKVNLILANDLRNLVILLKR